MKRFYVLLTSVLFLLGLNVGRILLLIAIAGKSYFEAAHWIIWNLVSIFFVVAIWFFTAWLYKVSTIPVYSDFLFLKTIAKGKKTITAKKNTTRKSKSKKRKNSK
jgi:phosphoglycerol transferase MdoB-like AlkP superfamily enzyme